MLRQSAQCCDKCKMTCDKEFKKILENTKPGLGVCHHKDKERKIETKIARVSSKNENYILDNEHNCVIARPVFMGELPYYKTKCILCKMNMKKVRSLLDEITIIRGKEVLSKCNYCKKSNLAGKCKRCEYIVSKFPTVASTQLENRQNPFEQWLYKVRLFLQSLLEGEYFYRYKINNEVSITELKKLLIHLEAPIPVRDLDIRLFPDKSDLMNMLLENKTMLQEILSDIRTKTPNKRYLSDDSLFVSPSQASRSCICKNIINKNNEPANIILGTDPIKTKQEVFIKSSADKQVREPKSNDTPSILATQDNNLNVINKSVKVKLVKNIKEHKCIQDKENIIPDKIGKIHTKKEKSKTQTVTSEEQLLLKMMKEREKEKKTLNHTPKPEKSRPMPKIEDLPELKTLTTYESTIESTERFIECGDQKPIYATEMVKGINIVPIHFRNRNEDYHSPKPLIFKVESHSVDAASFITSLNIPTTIIGNGLVKLKESVNPYKNKNNTSSKGIVCYQLSNKEFIDKGWTKLPIKKIMRRMNIYKMKLANPKCDWFEHNKSTRLRFYDTGEKLAEIQENGCGKWYYKNSTVALDFYSAEEPNDGQRYVIYSSSEEYDRGRPMPTTVLAAFDFLGNGVVYDHYGNIRLKYNQSEGMVVDEKIAPRGRWKWHTLNDPPVLEPVFIDTYDKDNNPVLKELLLDELKEGAGTKRDADNEMLTIELDHFVKEKANKLQQKFKPFQIRMKVVKINENFSLRIIDQTKVYVLFRNGRSSLKLNLGMLLLSDEIIDTEIAEASQVTTPYDRNPAVANSMGVYSKNLTHS